MPPHPFTHHEIFALVGPFSRRGHHVDVAATDRLERRLVFQSRDRSVDAPELGGLRETLELHSTDSGNLRLSRSLLRDDGLVAKLEMQGTDPARLLRCIDSIPPQRQFQAGIGFSAACDYELLVAGPWPAHDDAWTTAAGPLAPRDDASAAAGPVAAHDHGSTAAGPLAPRDDASAAAGPLAAHDHGSTAAGPWAAHDHGSTAAGPLVAHDHGSASSGPWAAHDHASAAAGRAAAIQNFGLEASGAVAADRDQPPTTLIWKRGFAKLRNLTVDISAPSLRGEPAEIVLATEAAQPLLLPRDLLAVLGWDWSVLRESGTGWRGKLRFAGREPARSRRAERQFERAVMHLAATLAEAPGRFHARWTAARWRVYARCATPLAGCVALIAATAALPRAHLTEHSALRMLIFNMPPLLMGLYFCLREIPRIEIPPLPRPLRTSAWPFTGTSPNSNSNANPSPSSNANPNPSPSSNANANPSPSSNANPNSANSSPSPNASPKSSANPNPNSANSSPSPNASPTPG